MGGTGWGVVLLLTYTALAEGWVVNSFMPSVGTPAYWSDGDVVVFQSRNSTQFTVLIKCDASTGDNCRYLPVYYDVNAERMVTMSIIKDRDAPSRVGDAAVGIIFFSGPSYSLAAITTTTLQILWKFSVPHADFISEVAVDTVYHPSVYVVIRVGLVNTLYSVPVYQGGIGSLSAADQYEKNNTNFDIEASFTAASNWMVILPTNGAASAPALLTAESGESLLAVITDIGLVAYHSDSDDQWTLKWEYKDDEENGQTLVSSIAPAVGLGVDAGGNATMVLFFCSATSTEPSEHNVYAITENGDRLWKHSDLRVGNASAVVFSASAGVVMYSFFPDDGVSVTSTVTALNATDGSRLWMMSDPHNTAHLSRPVLSDDGLAYVTASTPRSLDLWAITSINGDYNWSSSVVGPTNCSKPPSSDALTTTDADIVPVDPAPSKVCVTTSPPYPPALGAKVGYVPGIDGSVYSVDLPEGVAPTPPKKSSSMPSYVFYIAAGCGVLAVIVLLCLPRLLCSKKSGYSRLSITKHYEEAIANLQRKKKEHESRYTAIRKLGHGAFGEVYEVKCKKDGRHYALKRIPCDNEFERNEAVREWRMLCEIDHPNKITAYETFMNWATQPTKEGGHTVKGRDSAELDISVRRYVCIIMEYCPGGDLKRLVSQYKREEKRMPEDMILSYAAQICSLLTVLHEQSPPLVHRDLKPENILLKDNNRKVVVTDFGLAKMLSAGSYLVSHAGTVAYIAPETWDRHYSTGADVWALGCIFYAMASRRVSKSDVRVLWRESSAPNFQKEIEEEMAGPLGYSAELAAMTARLLNPDRKLRPSSETVNSWLSSYYPADLLPQNSTRGYGTTDMAASGAASISASLNTSSPNTYGPSSAEDVTAKPNVTAARSRMAKIPIRQRPLIEGRTPKGSASAPLEASLGMGAGGGGGGGMVGDALGKAETPDRVFVDIGEEPRPAGNETTREEKRDSCQGLAREETTLNGTIQPGDGHTIHEG